MAPRRGLTGAFFRVSLLFGRIARVFEAAAAGTLNRADVRAGVTHEFDRYNDRPELTALVPWERELFDEVVRPGDRVLVIGSGSGRELVALGERGHDIVGVDPSETANEIARRFLRDRNIACELVTGFYEDVSLQGSFDVVLFSYWCYSYLQGSQHRVAALRKARASLKPGGRVIVSYVTGDSMHASLIRLMGLTASLTGSDLRPEPGDDFYRASRAWPYFGYVHKFVAGEFEKEARAAGLAIVEQLDRGCMIAVMTPAA